MSIEFEKIGCPNCNDFEMEPDISFKDKWICCRCGLMATVLKYTSISLVFYVEGVEQLSPYEIERLKTQDERWKKQQKKNKEKQVKSFLKNPGGGTHDRAK